MLVAVTVIASMATPIGIEGGGEAMLRRTWETCSGVRGRTLPRGIHRCYHDSADRITTPEPPEISMVFCRQVTVSETSALCSSPLASTPMISIWYVPVGSLVSGVTVNVVDAPRVPTVIG